MKRVVITGMGAVTPLGNSVDEFWDNVKNGKSGVVLIDEFKEADYSTQIGATIKNFDASQYNITKVEEKRYDKFVTFGLAAAQMAYDDAGLEEGNFDPKKTGSLVGSGIGGINVFMEQHDAFRERGSRFISPFFIPMLITNILSGFIAIRHGFKGPNFSISSACATSNHSIGTAFKFIQSGMAEILFAGGAEGAINDMGLGGFMKMKAVSSRNDAPEKASRPFDKDRDGFVMADGAGVVVLEELEHAKKRGAKIYAEVIGVGMSDDAHHMAAPHPDGEGAALALELALEDAHINKEDVDYINTHGTSTPVGDISEIKAIKQIFGDVAKKLFISSTKSMVGHMLGASGAAELIATVKGMNDGIIHPTINVDNQDPECDLNVVPNQAIEHDVKIAMSDSFGFGGHNSVLVVKKYAD